MQNLEQYIINGQPVWRGQITKINGETTERPVHFTVCRLTANDAEKMGCLSANIYQNLKSGEECFIHRHPKEYYAKVFDNPNTHYIGVFVGERLIGMSYLHVCDNHQSFCNEIPGCPINFFKRRPQARVAALGADCVLPEYRGNNMNQIMISYRLEIAKAMECTDAASIVDRNNHWNMPPYFNNNFNMFATGIDPEDDGKIALMHHHISSPKERTSGNGIAIPYNRFAIIDKLIERGFIGTGYNKENATITFMPTARHTPLNNNIVAFFCQNKGKKYD